MFDFVLESGIVVGESKLHDSDATFLTFGEYL